MNTESKFVGATQIATSNPFGTARVRTSEPNKANLVTGLLGRVRAAVARARHVARV